MEYQALYRKYRPRNFDQVVGQKVVKQTLKNAIQTNKISHAYLLSGPRGTGKTTIAKILARTVNCLHPVNGNPCEECEACLASKEKECPDIIEIDAASNNGVEEIRELKNKISHVPTSLKYKVYIIDEVHMLTTSAFNALLKTLEEPPSHAIFILATTDVHKIPVTILSRCQTFTFKRIAETDLVEHLKDICEKESISIDEEVLHKISDYSDGCLRDALGLLDKLSSYEKDNITMNDLLEINGVVNSESIIEFIKAITDKDIETIVAKLNDFYIAGKDMVILAQDIVEMLEKNLIAYYTKKNIDDQIPIDPELIYELNDVIYRMKNSGNPKLVLEIAVLKYIANSDSSAKPTEIKKVEKQMIPEKPKESVPNIHATNLSVSEQSELTKKEEPQTVEKSKIISREIISHSKLSLELIKVRVNNAFATASKKLKTDLEDNWSKINDYTFDQKYGAVACILMDSSIQVVGTHNIVFTFNLPSYVEKMNQNTELIKELLQKIFSTEYQIVALTNESWSEYRNEFINNHKAKIEYKYIEEPAIIEEENNSQTEQTLDSEDLAGVDQIIQMFGKNIVKVD